jgi:ceramide glucosyltransferase
MPWSVKIFFILGGLLVVQSAWAWIDGLRFLRLVKKDRIRPQENFTPSAAVVIPCKGLDPGFENNLERFLNQDYPAYDIIFVVATIDDPAYKVLSDRLAKQNAGSPSAPSHSTLVVAGICDSRGEKVNNLLYGVESIPRDTQVYVFADIDAAPAPDWLRSIVAPLAQTRNTVSTGFRWYLPGKSAGSVLRAAWDASIATMLGDHNRNFAWGGSMAIRAGDFRRLKIAEKYWENTVSDDFAITRAVQEAGGRIAFTSRCLVASREESSVRNFLRWSNRQIIITRVYATRLWAFGLVTYAFYCGAILWGLAILLSRDIASAQRIAAAGILGLVVLLGAAKGYIRTLVARLLFSEEPPSSLSCYWQASPLVPWIMFWNFVTAAITRRIEWRGTVYDLVSRDKVRVIRRTSG